jgi:hypothetical protein
MVATSIEINNIFNPSNKFLKRSEGITKLEIPLRGPRKKVLLFANHVPIGKLTRLGSKSLRPPM